MECLSMPCFLGLPAGEFFFRNDWQRQQTLEDMINERNRSGLPPDSFVFIVANLRCTMRSQRCGRRKE